MNGQRVCSLTQLPVTVPRLACAFVTDASVLHPVALIPPSWLGVVWAEEGRNVMYCCFFQRGLD